MSLTSSVGSRISPAVKQMLCSTAQAVMTEGTKVDIQSLEEHQHAKGPLCNGTGLGMMLVEAPLHLPFQWFSIWGDDGHRSFNAVVATIPQYKVSCREWGNN